MQNTDQNPTQLEPLPLALLAEFDATIQFLSDLPTERAMKDMGKMGRVPDSVRKVVEMMALRKPDFIRTLRLQELRAKLGYANRMADKAMEEYMKANPDYDVQIVSK